MIVPDVMLARIESMDTPASTRATEAALRQAARRPPSRLRTVRETNMLLRG